MLNNAAWLDPVGGLVISLMVVQAGWGNTKSALLELADVGVETEMREKVEKVTTKALESVTTASDPVTVRYIQGIKAGQNYLMDVELGVPSTWTVEQTRNIENLVRERVGAKVRGVKKVRVRFVANSEDKPDFMDEFITGGVSATEDPSAHEHEHENENEHADQSKSSDSNIRRRN